MFFNSINAATKSRLKCVAKCHRIKYVIYDSLCKRIAVGDDFL